MRVLKKEWGDFWQIELHELIKDHLTVNSHDNDALESAGYTAENSAQAIGQLIEALVSKGVFSLEEAMGFLGITQEVKLKRPKADEVDTEN